MQVITTKFKNASLVFLFLIIFISYSSSAQVGIGTTDPKSTFEVNGSVGQKVNTISASVTLDDTYGIVICNNGSTAITVTLPDVTLCTGRIYTIKRNATSTANVTIAGTIDGITNLILAKAGEAVTLFSNGTEWKAVSTNNSSSSSDWNLTGNAGTNAATNFVGTTDAQGLVLKTNNTSRVNVSSDGVTKIGDVTNGHDTKIEADGSLMFEGDAVVWDDLRVSLDKGSSSASLEYVWGGDEGPQIWYFRDREGLEAMSFVVQIPHSWKEGTIIYPHIHWLPKASESGNVQWNLDYSWQNYDATTPLAFPTYTTSTVVATGPFVANTHRITSLTGGTGLDGTGKKISSILICRIWRNASYTADTYTDDAGLLSLDFHYQIDTVGSRAEYVK